MSPDASLPPPEQDAAVTPVMGSSLRRQVLVCTAKSCTANGSEAVLEAFKAQLIEEQLLFYKGNREGEVQCLHCGSVGFCAIGPAVLVYPDGRAAGVGDDDLRADDAGGRARDHREPLEGRGARGAAGAKAAGLGTFAFPGLAIRWRVHVHPLGPVAG